jgi:hypothetical protein
MRGRLFFWQRVRKGADAVTSLGTTLILKLLSDRPLFDSTLGDNAWLVGGASETGDRQAFLSRSTAVRENEVNLPTEHEYYPLVGRGERFSQNNPMEEQGRRSERGEAWPELGGPVGQIDPNSWSRAPRATLLFCKV